MISRVNKVCPENLNSLAQTVAGQVYVSPAKKYQKYQLIKTLLMMRAIIALRENGKGYAGLESVCGYMNLVPTMNVNAFNKSMSDIISSYNKTAEESMNTAADEKGNSGVVLMLMIQSL